MPWAFAFYAFLCHVAVHEEYHRPARAGGVGTEGAVSKAGGDAILDSPGNVSNWVNIVIIQKALVMRQKIGVESEFLDSQVQISTSNHMAYLPLVDTMHHVLKM